MNPELKEKWVAALESGDYAQGQSYLQNNNKFCCLGVLCDVMAPEDWHTPSDEGISCHEYGAGFLNERGLNAAGLTFWDQSWLADLNDQVTDMTGEHLYTFEDIAERIQKDL